MQNFNPRSPHGERPTCARVMDRIPAISTHAPRTGSDALLRARRRDRHDFNPRSPHGERRFLLRGRLVHSDFNPRSPHGERPRGERGAGSRRHDFNPRSPHGERQQAIKMAQHYDAISTHAPRTGSDAGATSPDTTTGRFQPTLPARGATPATCRTFCGARRFQPTLPARGATDNRSRRFFYHRLRFQPTLPARGATRQPEHRQVHPPISTHAPRTGSDKSARQTIIDATISTHAPRTGSDEKQAERLREWLAFQPTLPARGATRPRLLSRLCWRISTHAPRTGSDGFLEEEK